MLHSVAAVWCTVLVIASALRKNEQPPAEVNEADTPIGLSGARKSASELEFEAGLRLLDQLLQDNDLKQTLRTQFMDVPVELVQSMNHVPFNSSDTLPQRPKVCAVVANSHSVLATEAGARIDSVDGPVMRFNLAPTAFYERFVGSRTDIRVINDLIPCKWMKGIFPYPRDVGEVTFLLNTFGIQVAQKCLQPLREKAQLMYNLYYHPMNEGLYGLMETVRDSMSGNETAPNFTTGPNGSSIAMVKPRKRHPWATTGMVGLTMLLNLCEEVRHYGFIPVFENSSADNCQQHYWEHSTRCTKDGHHALTAEHAFWAAISTRGELPGEGIIPGRARLQGSPFANITKRVRKKPNRTVVPGEEPPSKSEQQPEQEPPTKSKPQPKKQRKQEPPQESEKQPEQELPTKSKQQPKKQPKQEPPQESEKQPEQQPPTKSTQQPKKQRKQEPPQEAEQQPKKQPQKQED